jgi:hypothetical protein
MLATLNYLSFGFICLIFKFFRHCFDFSPRLYHRPDIAFGFKVKKMLGIYLNLIVTKLKTQVNCSKKTCPEAIHTIFSPVDETRESILKNKKSCGISQGLPRVSGRFDADGDHLFAIGKSGRSTGDPTEVS